MRGLISITVSPTSWMLKKCSIPSSSTIRLRDAHQLGVVERDEVHREPGAHRFARLRMPEHDLASVRDPVDRPLAAGRELHHEQVGPPSSGSSSTASSSRIATDPGRSFRSWCGAVDRRVEDAEAARSRGEDRLEADGPIGIAELACGSLDLAARR